MSENIMVERVARALAGSIYNLPEEISLVDDSWPTFVPNARAAIEAMGTLDEPTLRLMAAAAQAQSVDKPFQWADAAEASHIAMIFSALQSEPDSKGEVPG